MKERYLKKYKISLFYKVIIFLVLFILVFILLEVIKSNRVINKVKNSVINGYPDKKIGVVFEEYFRDTYWNTISKEDNNWNIFLMYEYDKVIFRGYGIFDGIYRYTRCEFKKKGSKYILENVYIGEKDITLFYSPYKVYSGESDCYEYLKIVLDGLGK